jgi:hypothetical protein
MLRSTQVLYQREPATTIRNTFPPTIETHPTLRTYGPAWPHTHTMDVIRDGAFIKLEGKLVQVEEVTISGHLQWQGEALQPEYHILKRVSDGQVFAGAAISAGLDDGELLGLTFNPRIREAGVHRFRLTDSQRNAIRKLKLR